METVSSTEERKESCDYRFLNGQQCHYQVADIWNAGKRCAIHAWYPNFNDQYWRKHQDCADGYVKENELKTEAVRLKISQDDYNFEGAILFGVSLWLPRKVIKTNICFCGARIKEVGLTNSRISGYVDLRNAEIQTLHANGLAARSVHMQDCTILREAVLEGARIDEYFLIKDANLRNISLASASLGRLQVRNGTFSGPTSFKGIRIRNGLDLQDCQFNGDCNFDESRIATRDPQNESYERPYYLLELYDMMQSPDEFERNDFLGHSTLSFRKAQIGNPAVQESACRQARRIYEELGMREEADRHFYKEMVARRRQKKKSFQIAEASFQLLFAYGTSWWRIFVAYLIAILASSVALRIGHGVQNAGSFLDCLYYSFIAATTLGFGDSMPIAGWSKTLTVILAVVGTFAWAGLIAIVVRKSMR